MLETVQLRVWRAPLQSCAGLGGWQRRGSAIGIAQQTVGKGERVPGVQGTREARGLTRNRGLSLPRNCHLVRRFPISPSSHSRHLREEPEVFRLCLRVLFLEPSLGFGEGGCLSPEHTTYAAPLRLGLVSWEVLGAEYSVFQTQSS